ncbi:MAG: Hsp70 family protein, partial [Clostridia bacterium]|nr:Hsp70 family protein [Clostridia bacterium]
VIGVAFIWTMYYRLCGVLKINISKNALKALASALITNVLSYVAAEVAVNTVLSIIPGGVLFTSAACGLMNYYLVYYSGIVFMNMLVRIFSVGMDIEHMSTEELKRVQKEAVDTVSFTEVKSEAKEAYKHRKADGTAAAMSDDEDDESENKNIMTRPDHNYELHVAIDFGSTNSVMGATLYEWDGDEWAVSQFDLNFMESYPTAIVFRNENRDNPNVEKDTYVGRETTNLIENQAMPAKARVHFKPALYEMEGTDIYNEGVAFTITYFTYLYSEFKREVYERMPREVLSSLKTTLHISTPVRAGESQIDLMRQIAQKSGFVPENGIDLINTDRNEADCIKHLACVSHPEVISRMNNYGGEGDMYMLFIDIGGSTTDIELIRQSAIRSFDEKGAPMSVVAMWPKKNIKRPLGGCEVDQAICDYLVKGGFLLPNEVKKALESGNAKTRFRQFKETINNRLRDGMNVNNLGRLNEYAQDEDWNHAERRFNEKTPITPEIYENEICADYIDRMVQAIKEVFMETGVRQEQVDAVFVTGAGSKLYFIHDLLLGKMGTSPLTLKKIMEDESRL